MSEDSLRFAKNRAHDLLARAEADLAAGRITEAGWYEQVAATITPAYLKARNPRAQSGHGGDAAAWRHARSLLLAGIHKSGTFLDVGCANGHLMECLAAWAREETPYTLEPHGLDIAPELVQLARTRLPHWAGRIHLGNAIDWRPPQRYDFVRTGLEYVPRGRRRDLIARLLDHVVADGGRLLIGVYNEERLELRQGPSLEAEIRVFGFDVGRRFDRSHTRDERIRYQVLCIDR